VITITCPTCGPRVSGEFTFLGDVTPPAAADADISEWRRYLYFTPNSPDWTRERWLHRHGCNRVIDVRRHRTTNVCAPGTLPTARAATDAS
jgi:sarcosine oxidase subunit delta